ncbi:WSC domain-containing protein [Colletotrichum siamense]|nr:WSC domain-containing protein [Colletotrichum siamense]
MGQGYSYQSCYTDLIHGQRTLGAATLVANDMTIEKCSNFCSNYRYFGVEYAKECWCGNTIQENQVVAVSTECSWPCSGSSSQTCGAASRISLYERWLYFPATHATLSDTPYVGCFADGNARVLPSKQFTSDSMTAAACAANCAGYTYFGTQWSRECWCGNTLPTVSAPDADCSMTCTGSSSETCGGSLRLSVYGPNTKAVYNPGSTSNTVTTTSPATVSNFAYQGCYTDNVPQRVLSGAVKFDGAMTLEMCASFCSSSNYGVFGVEYSGECYCGNSLDTASKKVAETECTMKCKGNNAELCGDGNRLNVFALPSGSITATSNPTGSTNGFWYQSCWNDNINGRSLKENILFADDMTVEKCSNFCKSYQYFGLEYGGECYCGNTLGGTKAPEADCSQHCKGDGTQFCGNGNRLSLYSINPPAGTCNANFHGDLTSFSVSIGTDNDLKPWVHETGGAAISYVTGDQNALSYQAAFGASVSSSDNLWQAFNVIQGAVYEVSVRFKVGGSLGSISASLQVGNPGVGLSDVASDTQIVLANTASSNDGIWQTMKVTFTPRFNVAKVYLKASMASGAGSSSYVVWDSVTFKQTSASTYSVASTNGQMFVDYRSGVVQYASWVSPGTDDIVAPAATKPTIKEMATSGYDNAAGSRHVYMGDSNDAPATGPAWRLAGLLSGNPTAKSVMRTHFRSTNSNNCFMQMLSLGQLIGIMMLDGCSGQWQTFESVPFYPAEDRWWQMSIECYNQGHDASAWVDSVELRPSS